MQSSDAAFEIIKMVTICLHIQYWYNDHDKLQFWACITKEFTWQLCEEKTIDTHFTNKFQIIPQQLIKKQLTKPQKPRLLCPRYLNPILD